MPAFSENFHQSELGMDALSSHHPCFMCLFFRMHDINPLQGKLYKSVIDDVLSNVKEAFRDDGIDDQVLDELKHVGAPVPVMSSIQI